MRIFEKLVVAYFFWATLYISWSRGKTMAWDVTVPDTYAESHIDNTATEAGAAANQAAAN